MALAVDGGGDWRRVTRLLFFSRPSIRSLVAPTGRNHSVPIGAPDTFPEGGAGVGIQRDDAGVRLSPDHDDQAVTFEERRAADPKKCFGHVPVFAGVPLPDQCSGLSIETEQFAFSTEGVTAVAGEKRRATRAIVVAVRIHE